MSVYIYIELFTGDHIKETTQFVLFFPLVGKKTECPGKVQNKEIVENLRCHRHLL